MIFLIYKALFIAHLIDMRTKFKNFLIYIVFLIGILQIVAFLKNNPFLNHVARSTGSSPFPIAFYSGIDGEFWARKSLAIIETNLGKQYQKEISRELVQEIKHPYFIRIAYAYPFVFSDSIDEKIWRAVLNHGPCKDPQVHKIFGLSENETVKKITIISKDKGSKNTYNKKITHSCGVD